MINAKIALKKSVEIYNAEALVYNEPRKNAKKHSLRKTYNMDPDYESYVRNKRNIDYYAA